MLIFSWFGKRQGHMIQDELSAYVDGGPGAPSPAEVANHLRDCDASCETDLEQLRITVEILGAIAPIAPPRSFALTAEMVADLPDGKPLGSPPRMSWDGSIRRNSRIPTYVPAFAATAAAIVFALVLVGDLTGTISQSGSRSSDATSIAPVTAVQEMAVSEAATASEATRAGEPEIASGSASAPAEMAAAPEAEMAVEAEVVVTVVVEKEVAVEAEVAPAAAPMEGALAEIAAEASVADATLPETMTTPAPVTSGAVAPQMAAAPSPPSDTADQPVEEPSEPVAEKSLVGEAPEAPVQKKAAPDIAQISTEDLLVAGSSDGQSTEQAAVAPVREPEPESAPVGDIPVTDLESIPTWESRDDAVAASRSAPTLGESRVPTAQQVTGLTDDDDDGISLPVWQLLLATGLLALGLAITAVTLGRRGRFN